MIDLIEDVRTEFKHKLNESLEKEVISFLNSDGGNIYIGIDDDGAISGIKGNIDKIQREIKDRIKDNIMPSAMGLFDIIVQKIEDKNIINVNIAKGNQRPYYLKEKGMVPDSCYIRVGSSIASMDSNIIMSEFSKRTRNSLSRIISPKQDLSFKTLKIYYQEKGYIINDNLLKSLNLYTDEDKYNYIAYLLADENSIAIQFAKYSGIDVVDLVENENYGYCSLIQAADAILNKIKNENKTFTKIEAPKRQEIKLFDYDSVRELVINALVHNDWSNGYSPKFEIFDDRISISSNGGLPEGLTEEDFLRGFSNPKNPELMRVFKDLDFAEQLGTGIQRVLKKYHKNIFEFFPNHLRVNIPFKENTLRSEEKEVDFSEYDLNTTMKNILKLISEKPKISQQEIAVILGLTKRTIERAFKFLISTGYIERSGTKKSGFWKKLK